MPASINKWWLLPLGILAASALIALGIVAEKPEANKAAGDCSGAWATDYACYQKRYQDLVHGFGVEAAFAELKDEYKKNDFVKSNCHQLTHVIGRAAAERYDDIASTYSHGDPVCLLGYYHGATEAVVAKIGPDKVLEEADTLCSELGEQRKYSFERYDCTHGLGHGFMGIRGNELFEALKTCDALTDGRDRDSCYGGVFMENAVATSDPVVTNDPSHSSKYLKADQPLYPCTDVQTRYKDQCYQKQTAYALSTTQGNFVKVFNLCATAAEKDYRSACYQGVGWDAYVQASEQDISDAAINEPTRNLCMVGEDYGARSNCVVGAVEVFIRTYRSDAQAKAFCESLGADLRAMCLQAAEEYYKSFEPD